MGERAARAASAVVGIVMGAVAIAACSGSSNSGLGGDADAGDGSAQAAYTLDDVCAKTAPKVCALRRSCCQQISTYDEASCIAREKTQCAKDVADVRAGRAAFHPEVIDSCLSKLQPFFDSCFLTFDILYRAAEIIRTCRVFEGQLAEAAACERDSQCAPAGTDVVGCDATTKTCKRTKLVAEGEACSLASGASTLCNKGLYCDADLAAGKSTGTCKKATALGGTCDEKKLINLECGLGNYCERTTKACTAGKPGGTSCQSELECASIVCTTSGGSAKTCGATAALVKAEECKGP